MANQSFPPVSALRSLKSFQLEVQLDDKPDLASADAIALAIKNTLSGAGFATAPIGEPTDALLRCFVSITTIVSDRFGNPLVCSYVVDLAVMTTVAGQPGSDLFIVFTDLCFGSAPAAEIFRRVLNSATDRACNLNKSLRQARIS